MEQKKEGEKSLHSNIVLGLRPSRQAGRQEEEEASFLLSLKYICYIYYEINRSSSSSK